MDVNCDDFIKCLFNDNGIFAAGLKEQQADFLDNFIKRDKVQQLTATFVSEIGNEFQEAVKEQQPVECEEFVKMPANEEPAVSVSQSEAIPAVEESQATPVSMPPSPTPELQPGEVPPATTVQSTTPIPMFEQFRTNFSISANGKVNVDFRGRIEGKSVNGNTVVILDVTIDSELGLLFDAEKSELYGTPKNPGEFDLAVTYQFDPPQSEIPKLTGVCRVIVNPDPKTLWKNQESDRNDPFWKEDEATVSISGNDGFNMIAASKRGRSHAHVGSFRDDDFSLMHDAATGWRVMTVADGAGSAKLSRRGSFIASRTAMDSVLKALTSEKGQKLDEAIALLDTDAATAQKQIQDELYYLFGNAAKESVTAIEVEAKTTGAAGKDFSTTLIIAVQKKVTAGYFVAAYWVGDGGVGVYRAGEEVKVLGKADSGEFAGQTRFLDSAMLDSREIMNRIKVTIVPDFTAIIAMTDGITDPRFETDANIENSVKWDEIWGELSPVTKSAEPASVLLDWLDFWSPGNHDDRTIAILYPSANAIGQPLEKQEAPA